MAVKVRFVAGAVMIWLTAVAGVSTTAWFAIDRAGRDFRVSGASVLAPRSGASPTPIAGPTAGGEPSPTGAAAGVPTPARSTNGNPALPTSQPGQTGQPVPTPAPTPAPDGTSTVEGGQVSVRCSGGSITLRIAQPDNGWRVEVASTGPQSVDATFRRGQGVAALWTHSHAVCLGGAPEFTVQKRG